MGSFSMVLGLLFCSCLLGSVNGIGVNWGTQSTHPLAPTIVVQMLRDNGFKKVKLFDADSRTLNALANTGIEVMVGIPNDMLATLASSVKAAENWVSKNVSAYISKDGVNIKYVAVGNEPFLSSFNGSFISVTYPALQNIQSALIKAGLSSQVKVTVPLNADVYASSTSYPSGGDFRTDIHDLMLTIVKFLSDNGAPFTVNIYPFISLYNDPNFPTDFAFFDGTGASSLTDNGNTYTNVFDANHDTLVWALKKNGYDSLPIIVGEVGWPTDGDKNANLPYAQKFNQGFMTHVSTQQGTPMRPGAIDAYLFSLIDEDAKSIQPGNFERHWGVFNYDGSAKYQLNLGQGASQLVPAKNVKYLAKKWCIFSPRANLSGSMVAPSVSYACSLADCTSLGYGTSCGNLDDRGNISYAFNSYYQVNNQLPIACVFNNLGMVVTSDPSTTTCKFGVMIDPSVTATGGARVGRWYSWVVGLLVAVFVSLFLTCI